MKGSGDLQFIARITNLQSAKYSAYTMRRLFIIFTFLMTFGFSLFAQDSVYSGKGSAVNGYVYEDGMLDNGTRYIISDVFYEGPYRFSLCRFVPESGDSWYGLTVEAKVFIPENGLFLFAFKDETIDPILLGQTMSEKTTMVKEKVSMNPIFLPWKGGGIAYATQKRVKETDVYYAVYEMSEEQLLFIIRNQVAKMRISERSRYYEFNKVQARKISSELSEAKQNIDTRATHSRNDILEGLHK